MKKGSRRPTIPTAHDAARIKPPRLGHGRIRALLSMKVANMGTESTTATRGNSPRRVLFASLIGTTIEFFDFYIYATAAVLVFPVLFFPPGNPTAATLQSFATFALAFFARPIGSAVFGHFGDRIGRKATLVAALLTMGLSTVLIGALPTYASIGVLAPVLLCLCRFGQGLGLGGEWGGAVLLATENAPPGKRAWYGMFPQLGAPIGFVCSTGIFILLTEYLNDAEFLSWGWRIPFLASSILVFVGLYVRLRLAETPAFLRAVHNNERVRVPMLAIIKEHPRMLVLGTFAATATFVIFYLMTVFTLSWAVSKLGYTRQDFLILQIIGVLFFALTIPISAITADRLGRKPMLIAATLGIIAFGFVLGPLFGSGTTAGVLASLCIGLGLMGLTYGPLGTALSELFPTAVRYTGASLTFNLAGIVGASLAPYIATWLAQNYGLAFVGYYLSAAGALTLIALILLRTRQPAVSKADLEAMA
jgi:metabolite-proton symporter